MKQFGTSQHPRFVLFTDIDGTLTDHYDYSLSAAQEALSRLADCDVPLVFCSSKTFAEQWHLQKKTGLHWPMILENGSAIALPRQIFSKLPRQPDLLPDSAIAEALEKAQFDLFVFAHSDAAALHDELGSFPGLKSFSNASDFELSAATNLRGRSLQRARQRWYTETIIGFGTPDQKVQLQAQLTKKGWVLSQGGRFFTIQSASVDKGNAVRWMSEVFRQNTIGPMTFAAVGDSPNDIPMLAAADLPFLVRQHQGEWISTQIEGLMRVDGIGPAGFAAAVAIMLGPDGYSRLDAVSC